MKNFLVFIKKSDPIKVLMVCFFPVIVWSVSAVKYGVKEMISLKEGEKAELAVKDDVPVVSQKELIVDVKIKKGTDKFKVINAFPPSSQKKKKEVESEEKEEEGYRQKTVRVSTGVKTVKRKKRSVAKVEKKEEKVKGKNDPYGSFKWVKETDSGRVKSVDRGLKEKNYKAAFAENKTVNLSGDKSVYVMNKEDIYLSNGDVIRKNTLLNGFLSLNGNYLYVDVRSYQQKGKRKMVKLTAYDLNGESKGIVIQDVSEMVEETKDEMSQIADNLKNHFTVSVPVVGSLSIPLPTRKRNNKIELYVSSDVEFYLREL